jgi:hypothetical protein
MERLWWPGAHAARRRCRCLSLLGGRPGRLCRGRLAAVALSERKEGRHPAGLNFGACLTYAVARLAAEPLLCVGADFAETDLELA